MMVYNCHIGLKQTLSNSFSRLSHWGVNLQMMAEICSKSEVRGHQKGYIAMAFSLYWERSLTKGVKCLLSRWYMWSSAYMITSHSSVVITWICMELFCSMIGRGGSSVTDPSWNMTDIRMICRTVMSHNSWYVPTLTSSHQIFKTQAIRSQDQVKMITNLQNFVNKVAFDK